MGKSENLALVLAGGRGERLSVLTREVSKPAIPFGGAYRLIDFTLSNCKHSNVSVIGVLTQYRQRELAEYISTGEDWCCMGRDAEVVTLPPNNARSKNGVYIGTADAIWKNTGFVEAHGPDDILVLSGDHVYKMDYAEMLETHKKSGAAVTIAVTDVPRNEAHRFGIISVDKDDYIVGFEEKPQEPRTNLASMGVYVFNWQILKNHLWISSGNPGSTMDIGRDIIPQMLMCGEKLAVHRFGGYWRDVGNVYSLWEANMELLADSPGINLTDDNWRIISRNVRKPQYYKNFSSANQSIKNSLIADGIANRGKIIDSVISAGAEIGEDASIYHSVIMPGAKIGKGALVIKSIVGANAVIGDYTAIGRVKPDGMYLDNCQGVSVIGNNINISGSSDNRVAFAASPEPLVCAV